MFGVFRQTEHLHSISDGHGRLYSDCAWGELPAGVTRPAGGGSPTNHPGNRPGGGSSGTPVSTSDPSLGTSHHDHTGKGTKAVESGTGISASEYKTVFHGKKGEKKLAEMRARAIKTGGTINDKERRLFTGGNGAKWLKSHTGKLAKRISKAEADGDLSSALKYQKRLSSILHGRLDQQLSPDDRDKLSTMVNHSDFKIKRDSVLAGGDIRDSDVKLRGKSAADWFESKQSEDHTTSHPDTQTLISHIVANAGQFTSHAEDAARYNQANTYENSYIGALSAMRTEIDSNSFNKSEPDSGDNATAWDNQWGTSGLTKDDNGQWSSRTGLAIDRALEGAQHNIDLNNSVISASSSDYLLPESE